MQWKRVKTQERMQLLIVPVKNTANFSRLNFFCPRQILLVAKLGIPCGMRDSPHLSVPDQFFILTDKQTQRDGILLFNFVSRHRGQVCFDLSNQKKTHDQKNDNEF